MLEPTELKSYPNFSDSKHNLLCSELKQLYVAITRTRQRLWICENTEEKKSKKNKVEEKKIQEEGKKEKEKKPKESKDDKEC